MKFGVKSVLILTGVSSVFLLYLAHFLHIVPVPYLDPLPESRHTTTHPTHRRESIFVEGEAQISNTTTELTSGSFHVSVRSTNSMQHHHNITYTHNITANNAHHHSNFTNKNTHDQSVTAQTIHHNTTSTQTTSTHTTSTHTTSSRTNHLTSNISNYHHNTTIHHHHITLDTTTAHHHLKNLGNSTIDQHTAPNLTQRQTSVGHRMQERASRLKQICVGRPRLSLRRTLKDFTYYAPSHNLIVCVTPKVASSTWLAHLIHMRGLHPNITDFHTKYWKSRVLARDVLGTEETKRRLKSAVTVVTVRHPLSRLVSAFRDKFADGRKLEAPQSAGHYRFFWKPALRYLHKSTRPPLQVSFAEFVQFALDKKPTERHWLPIGRTCSPCRVPYQYVLMLETFSEDLAFLASSLNISTINLSQHSNKKSGKSGEDTRSRDYLTLDRSYLEYYLHLPSRLLARVLHHYQIDMELFGYKVPSILAARARTKQ